MDTELDKNTMGFLVKYISLSSIFLYFCWSLFFSVNSVVDLYGDIHHLNYTTRIHLEDLIVSDNGSVEYVNMDSTQLEETPLPGYQLYWWIMLSVSDWFQPHVYQIIKLTIVIVSLMACLACTLVWFGQSSYSCGFSPSFWLCHPTPLLLVELSLMITMCHALLMMFLGSPLVSGLMGTTGMIQLTVYFSALMLAYSNVSNHYKIEKEQAEEKLVEYETVYDEHDVSEDNSCDSDNSKISAKQIVNVI